MRTITASAQGQPDDNALLAQLPPDLRAQWLRRLQPVTLGHGRILAQAGDAVTTVYFPANCVVSLVHADVDGATTQVGLAGREGMVGLGAFLGRPHCATAMVLSPGLAFHCSARLVQETFEAAPAWRAVLLNHAACVLSEAWQIALCNRHHAPVGQLCSLLLLVLDRTGHPELALTHDTIARLLGLRRETVSQAAHRLLEKGYVSYRRGRIRVTDHDGLQMSACACYPRLVQLVKPPATAAA